MNSNLSSLQAAEDVNVTFEDQQKINKFARNTSRITELKEEIEVKKVYLLQISLILHCPELIFSCNTENRACGLL